MCVCVCGGGGYTHLVDIFQEEVFHREGATLGGQGWEVGRGQEAGGGGEGGGRVTKREVVLGVHGG